MVCLVASILFVIAVYSIGVVLWLFIVTAIMLSAVLLSILVDAVMVEHTAADVLSKHKKVSQYLFYTDLGAAVGPMAAYMVIEWLGILWLGWVASVLLLVSALLALGSSRSEARDKVLAVNNQREKEHLTT